MQPTNLGIRRTRQPQSSKTHPTISKKVLPSPLNTDKPQRNTKTFTSARQKGIRSNLSIIQKVKFIYSTDCHCVTLPILPILVRLISSKCAHPIHAHLHEEQLLRRFLQLFNPREESLDVHRNVLILTLGLECTNLV